MYEAREHEAVSEELFDAMNRYRAHVAASGGSGSPYWKSNHVMGEYFEEEQCDMDAHLIADHVTRQRIEKGVL